MIKLRLVRWALPMALGALAAALLVAVVVAREKRAPLAPSAVPQAAAPSANAVALETPAFSAQTTYGIGLSGAAPSPVASLTPALGNRWRELEQAVGRVLVSPSGPPSRYFEVSLVAFAPRGAARLEILTSEQERAIVLVHAGGYEVINYGPLLSGAGLHRIGLALSSVQPHSASVGADLLLSPLQSEYLAPGQAVVRMPALAETGPAGARGLLIARDVDAQFRITPGVTGRYMVALKGESIGSALHVTITVGNQRHSVLVRTGPAVSYVGPFSHADSVLSLRATAAVGRTGGGLLVSSVRLVPAPLQGGV
jgi:hypothetical protein